MGYPWVSDMRFPSLSLKVDVGRWNGLLIESYLCEVSSRKLV